MGERVQVGRRDDFRGGDDDCSSCLAGAEGEVIIEADVEARIPPTHTTSGDIEKILRIFEAGGVREQFGHGRMMCRVGGGC